MGVGDVVGVEVLAPFRIVDDVGAEYFGDTEVIVDIKRDFAHDVKTHTGLEAESDGFGIEGVVADFGRFAASHGLVDQGLLWDGEVHGRTGLCTDGEHVDQVEFVAYQNWNLEVHGIECEVHFTSCGDVDANDVDIVVHVGAEVEYALCLEPEYFRLHVESCQLYTAESADGEAVGEASLDVFFLVREFVRLVSNFESEVDASDGECGAAENEQQSHN